MEQALERLQEPASRAMDDFCIILPKPLKPNQRGVVELSGFGEGVSQSGGGRKRVELGGKRSERVWTLIVGGCPPLTPCAPS